MEHRVSASQLEELLEYLATHSILIKGAGLGVRSKVMVDREWQNLARRLNAHGSGASKTAIRWKRYWADLKHKVKARASAKRQEYNRTGGGPSSQAPLTETEKKVLHLIGEGTIYGDVEHTVPCIVKTLGTGSPTPRRKFNLKKASAQQKSKLDTSWIVELEKKRVRAEQKLADATLIVAEATKAQADAALLMAEAAKTQADTVQKLTETCTKILEHLIK